MTCVRAGCGPHAGAVFLALCGAAALSGVIHGVFSVASNALLGDSTTIARRNRVFVWKQACTTAGMTFGPSVAVVCFLLTHNTWTAPELTVVCLACAALGVPLALCMFLFTDVRVPLVPSEALLAGAQPHSDEATTVGATSSTINAAAAEPASAVVAVHAAVGGGRGGAEDDAAAEPSRRPPPSRCLHRWVAPLIALCDVFTGMGSGIVYKFVPLFLLSDLALPPITVQAVVASFQFAATLIGCTSPPVQRWIGPMGTVVVYRALACASLAAVAFSERLHLSTPLVVGCCVVRGAFMNAVGGITEAVLVDHTSARHRGKWQVNLATRASEREREQESEASLPMRALVCPVPPRRPPTGALLARCLLGAGRAARLGLDVVGRSGRGRLAGRPRWLPGRLCRAACVPRGRHDLPAAACRWHSQSRRSRAGVMHEARVRRCRTSRRGLSCGRGLRSAVAGAVPGRTKREAYTNDATSIEFAPLG